MVPLEILTLCIFCVLLLVCVVTGAPILLALALGLLLFLLYARRTGVSWDELLRICGRGVWTVRNILITFGLIGFLTALWRAAGTISVIVSYAAALIRPSVFLLMTFLLNCLVSVLTGTAFGSAATMGVICATIGAALGVDITLVGGAVLSGVYFGDRCSPVSTSALLVSSLTDTDIFRNIRRMLSTALVPFLLSCGIWLGIGFAVPHEGVVPDLRALFAREFVLHAMALLPALVMLLLSLLHVHVKMTMFVSILTALPLCVLLQRIPLAELPALLLLGFHAGDPDVAVMIDGGGLSSMLRVAGIVCISSSYSGIFERTGLLKGLKRTIRAFSDRFAPFIAMLITSVAASMVACNQTLSVILTHQLCGDLRQDPYETAIDLEDSAILVAPLVPWSIAGGVPLASVGAPAASILLAFYLYLVPLWRLLVSLRFSEKNRGAKEENRDRTSAGQ